LQFLKAAVVGAAISASLYAQAMGRNYGRSMVISQQGIAATSQVLASQAGAMILAKGGTAVDAAIASNAVLGVTEPLMTGLGGDLFVIYWDKKTGKLTGLNSSGAAPKDLTPEFLAKQGVKRMPQDGIHSVTVPGAVRGWWIMHEKYGKQTSKYWDAFVKQWDFISKHQIDSVHGGWYATVNADGTPLARRAKSDRWTEGYHQGRAMLNVSATLRRLAEQS